MKILIVNWGIETAIFPLKESVRLKGHQVYLATTNKIPSKIRRLFSKNKLIITNPYNSSLLIEDVVKFCKKEKVEFDVVTTFFEMNVYQTAILADYLGIEKRLPIKNALQTSANKYLMRMKLKEAGIRQPRFERFNRREINKAYDFYKKLNSSVILKPIYSGHSYGSRWIDKTSKRGFERIFWEGLADLDKSYDEWMDYFDNKQSVYLIEEFIEGKVFSIDGVIKKPHEVKFIGSAEFEMGGLPRLEQLGHTLAISSLSLKQLKECQVYVKQVIKALGLRYCGFHAEFKLVRGKPCLIEISGRLPGGVVLESHQAVSRLNIIDLFFSVFGEGERKVKRNKDYYKSESFMAKLTEVKLGKVRAIATKRDCWHKDCLIDLTSIKIGEVVGSQVDKQWLFSLRLRSKTLSSRELIQIQKKLAKSLAEKFIIDDNLCGRLSIDYDRLIRWIRKKIKRTWWICGRVIQKS